MEKEHNKASKIPKSSAYSNTTGAASPPPPAPEVRPDVLASYYLTDKQAWTVTRQYWVSHTTLESLGIASLSVKDRRADEGGERMKLDKHLPRCLEPRRGKWKVSRRRPYLDPRDRFGWDYFDYDVCPNEVLFPCRGQDQLKELVAEDWRIANETGALAKWARMEQKRKEKAEQEAKEAKEAAEEAKKNKAAEALRKKAEEIFSKDRMVDEKEIKTSHDEAKQKKAAEALHKKAEEIFTKDRMVDEKEIKTSHDEERERKILEYRNKLMLRHPGLDVEKWKDDEERERGILERTDETMRHRLHHREKE